MVVQTDSTVFVDGLSGDRDTIGKLVDNSPFCMYLVDADLWFLHASERAVEFYRYERGLIGKHLCEVLQTVWNEGLAREIVARFRQTLETGTPHVVSRETVWRKDIPMVVVRDWRIDRVPLADGGYGVVCQFRDLSQERKLETAESDSPSLTSNNGKA